MTCTDAINDAVAAHVLAGAAAVVAVAMFGPAVTLWLVLPYLRGRR